MLLLMIYLSFALAGGCSSWERQCDNGNCVGYSGDCRKYIFIIFIKPVASASLLLNLKN